MKPKSNQKANTATRVASGWSRVANGALRAAWTGEFRSAGLDLKVLGLVRHDPKDLQGVVLELLSAFLGGSRIPAFESRNIPG